MFLRIEQECPQCGGPLEMGETDRLLQCSFCNVQNFLGNVGPLRFILPRREPDPFTVYAPYLRLKGTLYSCLGNRIEHRLVDITAKGIDLPFLPVSLGLRPQAVKMRFATPDFPGSFLKRTRPPEVLFKRAARDPHIRDEPILDQSFTGDLFNIIYLPLSIRDEEILDGVTDLSLLQIAENATPFSDAAIEHYTWKPLFLPALCPQCGWNLAGAPDSVVLLCSNCKNGWQADHNGFSEIRIEVTLPRKGKNRFIPFWKFRVAAAGVRLDSFADFVRITNQPMVIQPAWEEMELFFVSPAFKIRPKDFLRLSTQMTLSRRYPMTAIESIPPANMHPVTLGPGDAGRILKTILANSAVSTSNVFPLLPDIQLQIKDYSLHYLPFKEMSHELLQAELGITLNQRVLGYGRSL